jgi:hypothetical protein
MTRARGLRTLMAGGALVLAGGLVAQALWSAGAQSLEPRMRTGAVSFAAQVGHDASTRVVSTAGEAVTLTLPGTQITQVLDQLGPDPDPVFWRFRLTGAAMGITGLVADVSVTAQVGPDGDEHDLSAGVAREGTVLAGSVVKVYPAAAGGDCSVLPATPEGEEHRNVLVYSGTQHPVQEAGANPAGDLVTSEWCVAIDWEDDPDGRYANEVQVAGTAVDGSVNHDLDAWESAVAFPRTLDPIGDYVNDAWVQALAADGTTARDDDSWRAVLYPDPSAEPDVVLTIDPSITNVNPQVATGDRPVLAP